LIAQTCFHIIKRPADLFRQINREVGTAFLIVTHDQGVAERTDRILEVSDGRLVQDIRNPYGAPVEEPLKPA